MLIRVFRRQGDGVVELEGEWWNDKGAVVEIAQVELVTRDARPIRFLVFDAEAPRTKNAKRQQLKALVPCHLTRESHLAFSIYFDQESREVTEPLTFAKHSVDLEALEVGESQHAFRRIGGEGEDRPLRGPVPALDALGFRTNQQTRVRLGLDVLPVCGDGRCQCVEGEGSQGGTGGDGDAKCVGGFRVLAFSANLDHDLPPRPKIRQRRLKDVGDASFHLFPAVGLDSEGSLLGHYYLVIDGLQGEAGLELWNAHVETYANGLKVAAGHPASFVPQLTSTSLPWRALYRVDAPLRESLRYVSDGEVKHLHHIGLHAARDGSVGVEFPLIRTHSGKILGGTLHLKSQPLDGRACKLWGGGRPQEGLVLHLHLSFEADSEADSRVRLGALDLAFSRRGPVRLDDHGHVQIVPRDHATVSFENLDPSWMPASVARIDARMDLAIETIRAGSQDDRAVSRVGGCVSELEAFESATSSAREAEDVYDDFDAAVDCLFSRRPPLVIGSPLADGNPGESPSVFLRVEERTASPRRTLDLFVKKLSGTQDKDRRDSALILDPDPFLVALVRFPALITDNYENTIATWSYDGFETPVWRFRLGRDQTIDLHLPPQAVGEEMERYGNVGSEAVLDFRFSPPARVGFRESVFAREYAQAPWNVRQLFGDERAEFPGVVVESIDYELLYGLACEFPAAPGASDDLRDQPLLRMADVFALAGAVPGPLPSRPLWLPKGEAIAHDTHLETYQQARVRWARTYDQLQARLGVLEAWNPHTAPSLSRKLDVRCEIRHGAGLANSGQGEDCEEKLCGGVLYGIEQPPVYRALLEFQEQGAQREDVRWSDSAGVEALALSSLGGWGRQTATFGVMTVIAEVVMGRTHTLRIEVIGRIACAWNRARHVVVYERTPGPSRQFVCYQNGHLRRPILRKTQEFVEILEPRRDYPDTQIANPRFTGPVHAWAFEEGAKFNVLSFWGETVGETGWKIPIWRGGQQPSDLYPEPVVTVVAESSIDGERREQPCVVDNPEDIYFYTEFSDRGAEPDRWPPIVEIECVDFESEKPHRDFRSGKLETASRSDAPIPSGLARCSFRLKPAAHGVDLTSERAGDAPIGAHLSVLTFSRGVLSSGGLKKPRSIRSALSAGLAEVRRQPKKTRQVKDRLAAVVKGAQQRVSEFEHRHLASTLDEVWRADKKQLEKLLWRGGEGTYRGLAAEIEERLGEWKRMAQEAGKELTAKPRQLVELVTNTAREQLSRVSGAAGSAQRSVLAWLRRTRQEVLRIDETLRRLDSMLAAASSSEEKGRVEEAFRGELQGLAGLLAAPLRFTTGPVQVEVGLPNGVDATVLSSGLALLPADWTAKLNRLLAWSRETAGSVDGQLEACIDLVVALKSRLDEEVRRYEDKVQLLDVEANRLLGKVEAAVRGLVGGVEDAVTALVGKVEGQVSAKVQEAWGEVQKGLDAVVASADQIVVPDDFEEAKRHLQEAYGDLLDALEGNGELTDAVESAQQGLACMAGFIDEVEQEAQQVVDAGLRLVRAFGKPPKVEGLTFSRPEIAYFFDEVSDAVGLTPVIARAQQVSAVADALKPLGIDLPAVALTDQVVPEALENFDLSSILPNVAGIDFEGLFPALKMPEGSDVRVRHGIDPESRRPWLQATFDVRADGRHELFSTSGLSLYAKSPVLTGETRVEVAANGSLRRETNGLMKSTWELAVGGRVLIRFVETMVTFDGDGNFDFDFSPDKIQLDATLEFVQRFLDKLVSGDDPPVRIEPTGVVSELSLPVPNVSAGAVGISNLSIGCQFALRFAPQFAIEAGFNLAKPEAPFTLTIFILGGAGYVTAATRYVPSSGRAMTRLDMAIAASASLSLALGPIEGGVFVYLGINARYDDNSSGGLMVAFFVLIRGHVSVLGIASATISLRLEASYDQGGEIRGKGTFSIRIKICWCFTLKVKKDVTYTLGRAKTAERGRLSLPGETIRLAQVNGGRWELPCIYPPLDPSKKSIFHQRVEEYLAMVA